MRRNKGITLIALVITIIVLLILAGVAIAILSGENGILKKAAEAKSKTDEAQVNESRDLKGLEYTIKKNTGERCWQYKKDENGRKTIITDGTVELPIGTYVNYDPTKDENGNTIEKTIISNAGSPLDTKPYKANEKTLTEGNGVSNQTFSNKATTNGWRVLGIDEKTGEPLITSADPVRTTGNAGFYLRGIAGYVYGESELNKVCSVFGSGYGATGSRSINVNDANKITGYNPNNTGVYDPEQKGTGKKYREKTKSEYGSNVKYSWTSSENSILTIGYDAKEEKGLDFSYDDFGFNWYNITSKTWTNSMQDINNPKEIVTLKSSYYTYYPDTLNESKTETKIGLNTTSQEFLTLFTNKAGSKVQYWLASSYICNSSMAPYYGMNIISYYSESSLIGAANFYFADGMLSAR